MCGQTLLFIVIANCAIERVCVPRSRVSSQSTVRGIRPASRRSSLNISWSLEHQYTAFSGFLDNKAHCSVSWTPYFSQRSVEQLMHKLRRTMRWPNWVSYWLPWRARVDVLVLLLVSVHPKFFLNDVHYHNTISPLLLLVLLPVNTHTHTLRFNGHYSRRTRVSRSTLLLIIGNGNGKAENWTNKLLQSMSWSNNFFQKKSCR